MFLFHFGTHPALSLYEIQRRFSEINIETFGKNYGLTTHDLDEPQKTLNVLGGTPYISRVLGTIKNPQDALELAQVAIQSSSLTDKKINIAFSSLDKRFVVHYIAFDLKKKLRSLGIKCRIIIGKDNQIHAAHIIHENLIDEGFHFWIISEGGKTYLTQTIAVQNIDAYSLRDYEKPFRDAKNGMLPPKLARMMINFAHPSHKILDPFCGTGTTLLEGIDLEIELDGSDAEMRLVEGAKENVEWFLNTTHRKNENIHILQCEAERLSKSITDTYDAIVTEGTLGPAYASFPRPDHIEKNFRYFTALYKNFFQEAGKILNDQGFVVICFPYYHSSEENISFFEQFRKTLMYFDWAPLSKPLLYGRPDQIVWREIVILQKTK